MPPSPWLRLSDARPDGDYLVLLSYLPLVRFRKLPAFFRHVQRVREQLQQTSGVVGYSLLARILKLEFWTLSAWESPAALQAFVRANPHLDVMSALHGHMGATRFIEWQVKGAALPPSWADAMARFRP
jgi:quinol monooxygenase YgiN